ncbi:MAG: MGMT family protein [Ardenticatenales bacterium]|nr:MGMT family protein [Ardenticatenales bacterium]
MAAAPPPSATFFDHVYAVVRRVPRGRVTTYGAVAQMLGRPRGARAVGYALNALKDHGDDSAYGDVPWQRVINAQGRISIVNRAFDAAEQAARLRAEGVAVDDTLRIDLDRFGWDGLDWAEVAAIIGRR